jgi:thiol-disulfide isomerase/thioredoxin
MIRKLILIIAIIFICNNIIAQNSNTLSGKDIVGKVSDKLNRLKNIQYKHSRVVDVKSELIYSKYDGDMTMLFTPSNILGCLYSFEDSNSWITKYNGIAEYFQSDKEDKMEIEFSMDDFDSRSFLNPSINSLKVNFEWLRNSGKYAVTSSDTLIDKKSYYNIYFHFVGKDLSPNSSDLKSLSADITFYYTIVVDVETYLPYKIIRKYSLNDEDITTTTFSNIIIDDNSINENFFTPKDFSLSSAPIKNVEIKNTAWELPILNTDKTATKIGLEGNVVMLEFFFVGCSPCKKAIPWLASLQQKYAGKAFKLFSVNPIDDKELIEKYKQKYPAINYDILYNAQGLIEDYNLMAYPKIILINKKGEIIYNGFINKNVIIKLIKENL